MRTPNGVRLSSASAPSRGEPIAASRLVTTAVVLSTSTGLHGVTCTVWRRNSMPPGRTSRRSVTAPSHSMRVRWAMAISILDWDVRTSDSRVSCSSGSVVESSSRRWWELSSRYSATPLLVTAGSTPVRTCSRPW